MKQAYNYGTLTALKVPFRGCLYKMRSADKICMSVRCSMFVNLSQTSYSTSPMHYSDVIMSAMASQITGVSIVYWTVFSGSGQRKYRSCASLAFVRGIHPWPVNSPHKEQVTRNMFPFDDVIMNCLISDAWTHFTIHAKHRLTRRPNFEFYAFVRVYFRADMLDETKFRHFRLFNSSRHSQNFFLV